MAYTVEFEAAVNHAMLYEVGGFWNPKAAGVEQGAIGTAAQRKAVGYVNDPADRGGETKFGVAQAANPEVNVKTLTWEQAKAVYYKKYWLAGQCDKLPPRIAVLHFDGCVNHGVKKANMFLQRAIGVEADGQIGPITLGKAKLLNEIQACNSICNQRELFYRQIVANNSSQTKFLNGWLRRISEMRTFSTTAKL